MRGVAVEVTTRGLSFVALEGTDRLLDWGIRRQANTESQVAERTKSFVKLFKPDVLILEEPAGSNKGKHIRSGLALLEQAAHGHGIRTIAIEWCSSDRKDVADQIVKRFPALRLALPEISKYSESKSPSYSVFVAAARGLHVMSLIEQFPDPAAAAGMDP